MVYLIRKNIKTKRPSDKLDYKKLGLFRVEERIADINYRLRLPQKIRIYPVFYISILEPFYGEKAPEEDAEVKAASTEYKVEKILDVRDREEELEYLIK